MAENAFPNGVISVPASSAEARVIATLFDRHMRPLTDSYLPFFMERRQIEQQYVASLVKLHRKSRSIDAYLDDRINPSSLTARMAWNETVDNTEREASIHRAFIESLDTHIIEPLNKHKEEHERKRKHIRENLKEAITAHEEYAENSLPSLKRTYLRKSQEAEELRFSASLSPTFSQNPNNTGPMSQGTQLNRSPSILTTSTALSDIRIQGGKPSNPLRTFLSRNVNARDAERSDSVLRYVRAKHEAEQADKEYRKGVHWQETLRLRRVKLIEGGVKSIEAFVHELSDLLRNILGIYLDSLSAVGETQSKLCQYCQAMVDKVDPERDSAGITDHASGLLSETYPSPTFYYNYTVGECKDLIFGTSLVDYATDRGSLEGDIPKIVRLCIDDIDRRGLEAEGIYWVSGEQMAVRELQYRVERGEAAFDLNPTTDDVYSVASFLKTYLSELPVPVFKFRLRERILHTERIDEHVADNFSLLRSRIRRLPPIHQASMQALVEHLARVVSRSDKNKMSSKNLATVFGPLIFGEDQIPGGAGVQGIQLSKDTLMEDLLTNSHILFQQTDSNSASSSSEISVPITYSSLDSQLATQPHPSHARQLFPICNRRSSDDDMVILSQSSLTSQEDESALRLLLPPPPLPAKEQVDSNATSNIATAASQLSSYESSPPSSS